MHMVLPSKVWEDLFQASHERAKTFLSKKVTGAKKILGRWF